MRAASQCCERRKRKRNREGGGDPLQYYITPSRTTTRGATCTSTVSLQLWPSRLLTHFLSQTRLKWMTAGGASSSHWHCSAGAVRQHEGKSDFFLFIYLIIYYGFSQQREGGSHVLGEHCVRLRLNLRALWAAYGPLYPWSTSSFQLDKLKETSNVGTHSRTLGGSNTTLP